MLHINTMIVVGIGVVRVLVAPMVLVPETELEKHSQIYIEDDAQNLPK